MIILPNGCTSSDLSVYPKNWQSRSAKISIDWYIMYRYYDPKHIKPKQVIVKRMNQFKTILERQKATREALAIEMDKLLNEGFNPFLKSQNGSNDGILNKETPLLSALSSAYNRVEVSARTKRDLKFMLTDVSKAVQTLGLVKSSISQVTRKTIKMILDTASSSSDRFNKNRSYLMILFSELCELELIETNPVRDIKKKKVIKRIRQVLTDEERKIVNEHLKNKYPEFHRFLHIFFHSGARISELLRVNEAEVDLVNQRYKVIIRKGREYREVWKTIKDIVLPLWIEILQQSQKGDFIFSKGLKPGITQIQPYQVTKRWYRLVKNKLGIEADFYSLKHLHTTEVVDLLSAKEAAKHNEHTSTAMVVGIYDVKRNDRQHLKVRGLNNKFA